MISLINMSRIFNCKILILFIILIIAAFLRLYNLTPPTGGLPPGLYPDEAMNGNNALEALSAGQFKVFYPENNGREGLFMNIQAVFLKFLMPLYNNNPEPWMLRVVSAMFGILTVLGIYFLAKELFRENSILRTSDVININDVNAGTSDVPKLKISHAEKIALLSSFLLATSFWHINFSRIGFRAIMAPFFMVWAIYFLLYSLNKIFLYNRNQPDKNQIDSNFAVQLTGQPVKNKNSYILYSLLGGFLLGLGMYSYIAFRVMPLLVIVIWISYWIRASDVPNINVNNRTSDIPALKAVRKKILISACLFTLTALIVFLPLGIYFLKNPADFFGRTSELSITHSVGPLKDLGINILKTAGMFNFIGDSNWRHNFSGSPELFWPVGILFLIGLFWGIKSIFRTSDVPNINGVNARTSDVLKIKLPFIILFAWLIIAALPVVISNEGIPHALRSILLIPPAIILAAAGGVWLYEWIKGVMINHNTKRIKTLNISTFIFLLILIFQAYYFYFIKWGQNLNVPGAFNADYAAIGRELNSLPKEMPKYVVVQASGVEVATPGSGALIPMPAQTVMFITNTFLPEKQKEKNIFYILPNQIGQIPPNSYVITLK